MVDSDVVSNESIQVQVTTLGVKRSSQSHIPSPASCVNSSYPITVYANLSKRQRILSDGAVRRKAVVDGILCSLYEVIQVLEHMLRLTE